MALFALHIAVAAFEGPTGQTVVKVAFAAEGTPVDGRLFAPARPGRLFDMLNVAGPTGLLLDLRSRMKALLRPNPSSQGLVLVACQALGVGHSKTRLVALVAANGEAIEALVRRRHRTGRALTQSGR